MKEYQMQGKKRIIGSTFAKIIGYFLLAISLMVGGVAAITTICLVSCEVYSYGNSTLGLVNLAEQQMHSIADNHITEFYCQKWPKEPQEMKAFMDEFCEDKNVKLEVWVRKVSDDSKKECIFSNYNSFDTPYKYKLMFKEYEQQNVKSNKPAEEPVMMQVEYEVCAYVNPHFSVYDEYRVAYKQAEKLWELRYVLPVIALCCIFLCICIFIFLMCGAGHKNGKEGIVPSVLTSIHFDVLIVFWGASVFMGLLTGAKLSYKDYIGYVFGILIGAVLAIWCTIFCAEVAVRLKMGQWWKHTLIYIVCRFVFRSLRFLWRSFMTLIRGLPLILNSMLACVGICLFEIVLFSLWGMDDFFLIWIGEKVIVIAFVLYIALVCKKLQEGSIALAEGNMNYKVDTTKMLLDFKEHGENLNRIGQGISKAVNERMKSEHMKTELITNVSHDIKTPLTSIINYADLLGNIAKEENHLNEEKVVEYSEVLLRQSKRLKKLLEDLVEASKATTGNIDVKMEKCEVGVLLSQAVGEYEQRFWEKQLELIIKQPEEAVWIMADGRRLWRVFDNLLNNVYKYAQENTRVYLTVTTNDKEIEIIFRNMSKYALDLTGEELQERFVRGDKSRHMEGNGLGLSIAKSLVELQKGTLKIVTDGDLFKVILCFPVLE